jgi:bifunctional aspartokinase / homoserine dehydrogenase 1
MLVMKFGGTSVGSSKLISDAAELVKTEVNKGSKSPTGSASPAVVVVSAMSGVTDTLLKAARGAAQGDGDGFIRARNDLSGRHQAVVRELITNAERQQRLINQLESLLSEFETLCRSVHILGELTARGADTIASIGERLSVRVFANILEEKGVPARAVDATEIIITDAHHGSASPLMDKTRQATRARLQPLLDHGITPVVTGFIGATATGAVTTLGRGGSDYSGAIIGNCLDADEIWIWTDVDGVMTADPRIVKDARTLKELSYAEAAELSYFGAKVLHPKTILPAIEKSIPLRIKNTFNPTHPGTLIVADSPDLQQGVKSITAIRGLSQVTVEGRGMIGVPGMAAQLFSAVARENTSVLMISQSSSEQNICFVIRQEESEGVLNALKNAFELELARGNIDRIWAQEHVAIIAVVGAGMKGTPGIAAKVFGALGRNGINIISIAQGSSEYNMSIVVEEKDVTEAVQRMHSELKLGELA